MSCIRSILLISLTLAAGLALSGCANKPSPPGFLSAAQTAMARGSQAYLEGDSRRSAIEYQRAVQLLSQTGRADLIAKAVLTQCAAAVTGLEFQGCLAFDALAQDASQADQAYARLLNGELQAKDVVNLPDTHRQLGSAMAKFIALKGQAQPTEAELAAVLALALLRRYGWPDGLLWPSGVSLAEAQGWRRPLLAWLEVGLQEKSRSGDVITRERLLRQRQRVLEPGSRPR
jgi:outer membrane lipoprotein SlyB